jgi:imidazole glycerol-phosphate synthase subunit HisH
VTDRRDLPSTTGTTGTKRTRSTGRKQVVVLDYGSGNVHSAAKALERAGADVVLTADKQTAIDADGLLVPGVGAFAAVMEQLDSVRGGDIVDHRLAGGRPVLGICVGMQVLFERGVERGDGVDGLGQWPGVVEQLDAEVLPHMGWNTVDAPADSVLFDGIRDERFYFVHSYGVRDLPIDGIGPLRAPKLTWAEHGHRFLAAVENGPLSATQFHPEKSGEPGIRLLRNWVDSL